ncbi:MAG TPA: hypothetical protein IGS52_19030 [Oscillatoriaceae cyanobacterium M33_DOE_052]|uniref:Uncharacterized protein n=1 Tax=Planktothricoides sp. SpSt-374 TaxID=2282167 RepID=A0A7C3ZZR0_9CYAN|nr:hypothetical protein [Oscillatoriaceae cyanobacterium M33_DOE_052]
MRLFFSRKKLQRLLSAGLAASLIPFSAAPVLAYADSDTGNLGQTGSETSGILRGIINVTEILSSTRAGDALSLFSGGRIAIASLNTIKATKGVRVGTGGLEADPAVLAARDGLELEVKTSLLEAGARSFRLRNGTVITTDMFAMAFTTVTTFVFPKDAVSILQDLGTVAQQVSDSSTGELLVASSAPVPIAQRLNPESPADAIQILYNTFNDAFSVSGIDPEIAQTNAKNLVLSLSGVKDWFATDEEIDVIPVNKTTKLMEPILKDIPKLRLALGNNPTANDYLLILHTMTVIDTILTPLQVINDLT